jgi:hypothetical protein
VGIQTYSIFTGLFIRNVAYTKYDVPIYRVEGLWVSITVESSMFLFEVCMYVCICNWLILNVENICVICNCVSPHFDLKISSTSVSNSSIRYLCFSYHETGWTTGVGFPAGARDFSLLHSVQTGSGDRPASYRMCTVDSFPGGKTAGA